MWKNHWYYSIGKYQGHLCEYVKKLFTDNECIN
jgi:hypothetical protein